MYRKSSEDFFGRSDFALLDLLCLGLSFWLAFWLRQRSWNLLNSDQYVNLLLISFLAHLCLTAFEPEYRGVLRRNLQKEAVFVFRHTLKILLFLVVYLFLIKASSDFSRGVILVFAGIAFIMQLTGRTLWKHFLRRLNRTPKRLLLLVADRVGAERILGRMQGGTPDFLVSGIVLDESPADGSADSLCGVPVVAHCSSLPDYLKTHAVDEILFSVSEDRPLPYALVQQCRSMGLSIHLEFSGFSDLPGSQTVDEISGIPVLTLYTRLVTTGDLILKRAMDIAGGLVGLLLTGLISIFLAPAIYFSDPGPIFFIQDRVGRNGRIFRLYKFRSMYQDAEARKQSLMERNEMQGLMFKIEADPRVIGSGPDGTRHGVGHFIRSTSLDEFPQFWNVLKGDMSLVGTRPPTLDEYCQYAPHHHARLAAKPGITGLWQVSGRSNITNFEEVVKLDTEYIENWSFWLDVKILFRTFSTLAARRGAK